MQVKIGTWVIALIFCMTGVVQVEGQVSYYVGQTIELSVENHAGSSYQWNVYTDAQSVVSADASAYSFTSAANSSATAIIFSKEGTYYPTVFETNASGCSAGRNTPIVILENDLQYALFPTLSTTLCYGDAINTNTIELSFTDEDGTALDEALFPISLNYSIDGVAQTAQTITFSDQTLSISTSQLSGTGSVDRTYEIELTGATDAQNQEILPQTGQNIFSLITKAEPNISLAQTDYTLDLHDRMSFSVSGQDNFIYTWVLTNPLNSSTTLSSIIDETGELAFDLAGEYLLRVKAEGSNGCVSDWQTVSIVVIAPPPPPSHVTPVLAISDINQGWENETLTGNVLTNDLYDSGTLQLTVIAQPDASAGTLTSFNRTTGAYTFVPATGFTGDAAFEYTLCETNAEGKRVCSNAYVTIQVLDTDFEAAYPVGSDKIFAIEMNGTLTGNFLEYDFNLDGASVALEQVTNNELEGNISYRTNGVFTYQPETDFYGQEKFNYEICNAGVCDWATVTIYVLDTIYEQNDLFASDVSFYNSGILSAQLPDNHRGDGATSASYSVAQEPSSGTVVLNSDGSFEYLPNVGETGYFTDAFVYQMISSLDTSMATAYISSYIEEPVIIVKSEFTVGACASVVLDASKSSGVGPLTYSWSPSTYLSDASSSTPIFTPGQSTSYTLTLTDGLGNTVQRTVQVEADSQVEAITDALVFVENSSESILLDATASTGDNLSFSWTSSGSGVIVSGANTSTPEVKGAGKYYLTVTDENGCMDMDSVTVGVWIQAVDDEAEVLVNNYVSINVLRNDIPQGALDPTTVSILVQPTNGIAEVQTDSVIVYTPNDEFSGEDNFVYRVCDYYDQCDDATVLVIVSEEGFFIPNAFTPNNDGYNDYFEIKGLSDYNNVHLKVFNRWGNLVYEAENYGDSEGETGFWDGVANRGVRVGDKMVPAGTYYYILDLGNGDKRLSGFIFIER
ncbi:Ig-like domain-containing protein [Mangrovibacterium sp.]|uniref:Ig-like domain-containing protein n=1 Tax=Mangrovibacterium sp. TaxID=1961364 RepID=UPI003566F89C